MATNEELEQRIVELESMIKSEYDPPSGAEYSFPVPGQPIDQDQFQLLSLPNGSGIIDRGGQPYNLTKHSTDSITNQKNTLLLKVSTTTGKSEGVVGGYYHVMNEDKEIEFPAVTKNTTYYLAATYDPRTIEAGDSEGPVKIVRYDTEPPTTFNRVHTELWTVARKPNELLSNAVITRLRPRIAPAITVAQPYQLPDPTNVLWGQIALVHRTNEIYVAVGDSEDTSVGPSKWQNLSEPVQSYTRPDGVYKWPGHGSKASAYRVGNVVHLEGRLERGDRFTGQNYNSGTDYELMTLPEGLRPLSERRFTSKDHSYKTTAASSISIHSDGRVIANPDHNATWIGLDGITFTLNR